MKNSSGASALVVAKPSGLYDGLEALLTAIPDLVHIRHAYDDQSALRIVEEQCSDLVLVSTDALGDKVATMLECIKARCPRSRSIVLVNDTGQQDEARAAGADVVVLVGIPATALATIIQSLLNQRICEQRSTHCPGG